MQSNHHSTPGVSASVEDWAQPPRSSIEHGLTEDSILDKGVPEVMFLNQMCQPSLAKPLKLSTTSRR